ncbi:MAG: HlyC/CorC family transporter [Candidatus Aenigmarchaeota archaeon]|nr:HlyC/CorC family transporter [Candidatus Aenigmarchaeota archaeon]
MEVQLITLFFLIILSAIFSGAETAIFSLSDIRVRSFLKNKKKGAKTLMRLKENPHRLLITLLVGNNVVNISASALTTLIAINTYGSNAIGIATGVLTLVVLVFCEITPKTYAHKNAQQISLLMARPLELLSKALYPLVWTLEQITGIIIRLTGGNAKEVLVTYDELKTTISLGAQEGVIKRDEEEMLRNVFEFANQKAEQIMVPRTEMFCIDVTTKPNKAVNLLTEKGYSRIPVYNGSKDNIVGILYAKDLLKKMNTTPGNFQIKELLRPAFFIPETKNLDFLLKEFKKKRHHMAIVVDDSGGVEGLVTLEDLIEEIVGEIYDETDKKEVLVKRADNGYLVDARVSIDELNSIAGTKIEDARFGTVAGYIINRIGRIPQKGEKIKIKKMEFLVEDAKENKIIRLRLKI